MQQENAYLRPCTCHGPECIDCTWQPFADRYQALVVAAHELAEAACHAASEAPPGAAWHSELQTVAGGLIQALATIDDWGTALEAMIGSQLHIQAEMVLEEIAA